MNIRVMVVDDDRSMCQLIEDALAASGMAVESRLHAEEAVELLKHTDVDVIVTDLAALVLGVERAVQHRKLREQVKRLESKVQASGCG